MTDGVAAPIKPATRASRNARASVYERVREAILSGEIAADDVLVELHIAKWCNVSRTPVREAFTRLEQDGLLERTDHGLVVKQRSPEEILDIYEIRIVLESLTARYAAQRHTQMDAIRLRRQLSLTEDDDSVDYATRNREFHRVIWAASHNEALVGLLERLSAQLARYPATTLTVPGRWEESLVEHAELVKAVLDRDAERSASIATGHFVRARDIRLELYAREII